MKPLKILLLLFASTFFSAFVIAQINTDLPGPTPNIKTLPAGTLIIAMDNTNQAAPGYFNLRAYGMAVNLMWADRRLRWVITAGKAKDATDISVVAERAYPSHAAASSRNFKAGPLVIFPQDTAGVGAMINSFNSTLNTNEKVNVYRTTVPVNADVRYDLVGSKPKAVIMNIGGKANIHAGYMAAALIPTAAYSIRTTPMSFARDCVTFVSEPHNSKTNAAELNAMIDSLNLFLQRDGGNFLAECAAVRTYENHVNGHFQFSSGIADVNRNVSPGNNVYPYPDLSLAQFEGAYDMDDGGNLRNWRRSPGAIGVNNVYIGVKENQPTKDTMGLSVSKMEASKKGGLVTYLGNHRFGSNNQVDINGIRIYLNAFLTPSRNFNCFSGIVLAAKFIDFKAQKINNDQVLLTWTTGLEINSKDFIIERSPDGQNFYEIAKMPASGNSSTNKSYSMIDKDPIKGKNFYRVTEVDHSGNLNFSSTVYVNMNIDGMADIEIYPNPADKFMTINTGNTSGLTYDLRVIDMAGRLISNSRFNGNTTQLDVRNMQPGNYILILVASNGEVAQRKFVVVKNK